MKAIPVIVLAILFGTSAAAQTIKYDGYYYAFADAHNDSSWHYLRFYPDGTVIEVNSIARPGKLMANFKKEVSPDLFQGTYTLNGNELQFSVANQRKQKVVYKGRVDNDRLNLRVHSFVNGFDTDEIFQFARIEGIQ